ncbi:sialate O-acetylesterase [Qipengyuania gelatinilytica]|uniref:Sialate O-acetylesterase n=1 Tax=Qipengyuania gelatinilytica TaxID=2867231 RepID=A0ABX9A4H7_9SPHN|nr:sialate O-acetylesterase [Qipengyuania gelatinilytica]QZD96173.1 sialate O-acetylesterase [Qipengyuania gelatinilytica]
MRYITAAAMALLLAGCAYSPEPEAGTGSVYKVYFLNGQSNMEGFGYSEDLPDGAAAQAAGVLIFHGRTLQDGSAGGGEGLWTPMQPGHGFGFETDGKTNSYSDRFGPELTFAGSMSAARDGERVAIIKFTRGGTALVDGVSGYGSWDPEYADATRRNQLDYALSSIESALAARDIDGDGIEDTLVPSGIVWMQGEADAFDSEEASSNYAQNLRRIMRLFRGALGDADLPVVIGRIKDSGDSEDSRVMRFSPRVQQQQAEFVAQDECAALVDATRHFGFLEDGWHYRSEDYVVLGRAFADAMTKLETDC